ncbi:MAG: N-6 DNA methylase [Chloroflexota bacterium]|nr:N-6 DNA methylase [Chloroflexota bacterium]MDE2894568.1 N-6 DNA methylase [Chloroflexota bacterium]
MSELRQVVKQYLDAISAVSRVGTPELSHYTALDNLFDAVGGQLTPKVRAVVHYSETNPGQPDLGFFSGDNTDPDRGVVEVKGADADLEETIASEQVDQYWQARKLVLVTNLREFALVGQDNNGAKATLERYSLADSVPQFDELLEHTTRESNRHGVSLGEYLLRTMSHRSTISEPRDLARLLASYARDALQRVEQAAEEEDSLATIRKAIEQALGMSFESEDGGRFFRSTLVQTLFYGVFAAWVLWARAGKTGSFGWKDTVYELRAPVLRMLFHQITDPGRLERLGLDEVLDWTEAALERVDREAFLTSFSEGEAVQYFYEPFLEAFDPDLRKQLGVWYTPREIVRYMVARVDRALRDDLGIPKGLADERVYVLDPCCGTGAFLVETLRRIAATEQASGGATWAESVRQAAATRVFGFEIMPAPLVVSHLEIGLALERLGAGLSPDQRAGVFLTNALTGWEPHTTKPLPFPELEQERRSANQVKQQRPILVVLGNPPYNGFPGVPDAEEERKLSDAYRQVSGPDVPKPQGQGLNDLYVRFFRMAERRIAEKTGKGVVCFISNYSWLDGLSFPGMRQRYLDAFDTVRIDNLHGDRIISEYAPDGRTSETVFAIKGKSPGIRIGTAITMLTKAVGAKDGEVMYRDFDQAKAEERRSALVLSLDATSLDSEYRPLAPHPKLGLPFKPTAVSEDWFEWPSLVELFPTEIPGVKTNRDSFLVDIDRERLVTRISDYFNPALTHEQIRERWPVAMRQTTSVPLPPNTVRNIRLERGVNPDGIVPYAWRPFDVRWIYWESEIGLVARPSPHFKRHAFEANMWIEAREREPQPVFQRGTLVRILADNFGNGLSNFFPLYLRDDQFGEVVDGVKRVLNLSDDASSYIKSMGVRPEDLFFHALATLHNPSYRAENADPLRLGWPRIPLPKDPSELALSAARGQRLARLLDTESDVADLLTDHIHIAVPTTVDGNPMQPADFHLTAGWGHFGADQAVMPGQGKVERRGDRVDVYLNDNAYWRDIPLTVWNYRLGGYQVLKKWLSYRESKVLGRALEVGEVSWFSEVARRIAVILETH